MVDSDDDDAEPAKPKNASNFDELEVFAEGDEAVSEKSGDDGNNDEDRRNKNKEVKSGDNADDRRNLEIEKKTLA